MSELKFRAWDLEAKCYIKDPILLDNFGQVYVVCEEACLITHKPNVILEQYTGLKDKNGKEIYVGDIVRAEDDGRYLVGAVEWNEDYAKCEVIYSQITGNSFEFEGDDGYPVANSCEVIGNIHENPELLEEEE